MRNNFDESVNVNTDKQCKLLKIVNNNPKELVGCSKSNKLTNSSQWVGGNKHGDFFMSTCECGKVSKPFFMGKNQENYVETTKI